MADVKVQVDPFDFVDKEKFSLLALEFIEEYTQLLPKRVAECSVKLAEKRGHDLVESEDVRTCAKSMIQGYRKFESQELL